MDANKKQGVCGIYYDEGRNSIVDKLEFSATDFCRKTENLTFGENFDSRIYNREKTKIPGSSHELRRTDGWCTTGKERGDILIQTFITNPVITAKPIFVCQWMVLLITVLINLDSRHGVRRRFLNQNRSDKTH